MKLRFCLLIPFVLLVSLNTHAQTNERDSVSDRFGELMNKVFNTKVRMDVDTSVFNIKQNNFYFTEAEDAMIMTMVAPQSFAKAEEHFEKEVKKGGYKLIEKRKFNHNGKRILYQKGLMKRDGEKVLMYLYAIEALPESTIFFTAVHKSGAEKKIFPLIEKAALSASLE